MLVRTATGRFFAQEESSSTARNVISDARHLICADPNASRSRKQEKVDFGRPKSTGTIRTRNDFGSSESRFGIREEPEMNFFLDFLLKEPYI